MSFADEAHLLLIEEDEDLRKLLMRYLSRQGLWVTGARSAGHGLRLMDGLAFDLVLLSANGSVPPEAAAVVARASCPVIGLAGGGAVLDGPDLAEVIAKPFQPATLLERINARLDRRPGPTTAAAPRRMRLGALVYDVDRGEMWHGDDPVRLTATESLLMRSFAARPGEALSRERLVTDLGRGGGQSQERAVDVQITRLRRKIEPDPKMPKYLQTVRGAGYLLAPD